MHYLGALGDHTESVPHHTSGTASTPTGVLLTKMQNLVLDESTSPPSSTEFFVPKNTRTLKLPLACECRCKGLVFIIRTADGLYQR